MSYFIDICLLCFNNSKSLKYIKSQDTVEITTEDKLKYVLPEKALISEIPKYICPKCENSLNTFYEFKQKCLQSMTAYEKYAQQITRMDGSLKYLSVTIRPDFMYKTDVSDGNHYDTKIQETQIEIDEGNIEKKFIKEEKKEEYVSNNRVNLFMYSIKEENSQIDDTCNQIEDNLPISDDFVSPSTENGSICEQGKKELYYDHKTYHEERILNSPIQLHGINKYKCQNFQKEFDNYENLSEHKEKHHDKKPYKCETCNKSFGKRSYLARHKLIHTSKKPYICKVCNKSFRRSQNLKEHELVHTDEKPHTCEVCNLSFKRINHLKQHRATHTDNKPFTCDVCKRSFRQLYNLKQHKFTHTNEKPYTCDICNHSFRMSHNLKRHRMKHTDKKSLTCEVCNKLFKQLLTLQKHRLIHTDGN